MSDAWTKRGYNCVAICVEQDLPVTASYVNEIVKQRGELLKALKESTEMLTSIMEGEDWGAIEEQIVCNQEAITKAEVEE